MQDHFIYVSYTKPIMFGAFAPVRVKKT